WTALNYFYLDSFPQVNKQTILRLHKISDNARTHPVLPGFYFTPVLPNPPAPLEVSESSSTECHSALSCLAMTNWAIRSPFSMVKASVDRLISITPTSPL